MNTPPSVRRIGLFGGSFDPVHQGHLALARCALDHLRLEALRFVPVGQAWQKARALTPAVHREAMLHLAVAGEPRCAVERCELERAGPSYTVETVETLRQREPAVQWTLVIGQDQYANLHTWHRHAELLQQVSVAVAARDGRAVSAPALAGVPHRLEVLPMPPMPVSATDLRERLLRGDDPLSLAPSLIPPAVARYIARHALYRTTPFPSSSASRS